jgi:hypothetical protein
MANPTKLSQLSPPDFEALGRSIRMMRERGGPGQKQIQRKLDEIDANDEAAWLDIATFASYAMQDGNLQLKSWQVPDLGK